MGTRKSISKRTRFEIFKRDLFTCQYCGRTPPNVVLHIDHINPVANGGDSSQDNLITSCEECNQGKSDKLLSSVPKSLAIKASEIKEREEQLLEYYKIMKSSKERLETEAWHVMSILQQVDRADSASRQQMTSIFMFQKRLGYYDLIDAAECTISRFGCLSYGAFKYFCGVCWKKIKDIKEAQNG